MVRLSIATLIVSLPLLSALPYTLSAAPASQAAFADSAFRQVWERTDAPVLAGQARRSWYWGPQPGQTMNEPYSGGKGGTRLVQYFDKARMEINNPDGNRSSEWFVTTGLLVVEMVSGKQQVGDKEFAQKRAAEIAVGGDGLSVDPDAPTYTSFRTVASLGGPGANRAPRRTGQAVTATINRAGQVRDDPAMSYYPGGKLAAYNDVLGHNIPQAMWDFLHLKGPVQQDGRLVQDQTLANWIYVMGYPITEPYWARVKINGIYRDALFQLYERRSLAYIPSMPQGWQVQMGNVGQHYHRWLYGGPLPTPLVPLPTASGGLLPSVNASVNPQSAPVGAPLAISIQGFAPWEDIVTWFTAPDRTAFEAGIRLKAGQDGSILGIVVPTAGLAPGAWALTFHGLASKHQAIAYFQLTEAPVAPTATRTPTRPPAATPSAPVPTRTPTRVATPGQGTPTVPVVPTQPPGGLVLSVRPGYGSPDDQFTFSATGLAANEPVQVKFTDPNGAVVYPADSNGGRYRAGADGRLSFTLVPEQAFPSAPLGLWFFEVRGEQSGQEGVIGFSLR